MISKSAAKVQKIFGICKDLHKKTHPRMRFWAFSIQPSAFRGSANYPFLLQSLGVMPVSRVKIWVKRRREEKPQCAETSSKDI